MGKSTINGPFSIALMPCAHRCRSRRRGRARCAAGRGAVAGQRRNVVAGALGHRGGAREAAKHGENMGKTIGRCGKIIGKQWKTRETS